MTKQDILEMASELNVRFVRLQFTDILGMIKNVSIPVSQLEKALDNEIMFDGSSIDGFTPIEASDMNLRPDPDTFVVFPWRPKDNAVARLICDVYTPEGEPFAGDPRGILKRVLLEAAEMGYQVNVGPEAEFFLFALNEAGMPTTLGQDEGHYFDLAPVDKGEDVRRDMVLTLEKMGFEIEASHHEVASGQHEIDFKYDDALTTADRIITFKMATKAVACLHGLHCSFMPKPVFGINGSGMHTHLSLFKDGKNAFYDPQGEYQLSETALYFIGGLLKHAPGFTAITNPLVNSYKRLVPGFEAPVYISWSPRNRSAMIRVPAGRGQGTRIELRSPDPSCNPYLALAVIIKSGLDGVKNRIAPPRPIRENIYHMTAEERKTAGIRSLPASLWEALLALQEDEVVCSALGEHALFRFVEKKTMEWDAYRTQVHDWELKQYLKTV